VGLVVLLAVACAAVGVSTVLALEGFLVRRLDQQLTASGGRFAASLEHGERPDADNRGDTRGQSEGTFGARLLAGRTTRAAVVGERNDRQVLLSARDRRALAALPHDGKGHSLRLSALGEYRAVAVRGDDGDVLVTGLPLRPVEETVHRLELVEALVFSAALAATAATAALWVRASLRPLVRVAVKAGEVSRQPLATGEVAMPEPLPYADPGTEVGQVAAAFNHMLGHVGDALVSRHTSQEQLRHFAADASHELRTPVAAVRAHAELALRRPGPMPEDVRHALERIESEARRLSGLVEDLLLLARLDAGRPLAREEVDLTRLALDAVDDARAVSAGHRWVLDLPPEPVTVEGDGPRLHQVLANLLANARAHTPPGTRVTVLLSTAAGPAASGLPAGPATSTPPAASAYAELTVADDGPGIPAELLPDLFHRFTRADRSRSRAVGAEGGSGLGLAIVEAVVHAHRGTVEVTSRPGRTAFVVRLPCGDVRLPDQDTR
jgi:two-component system OmpR family sensor kinase